MCKLYEDKHPYYGPTENYSGPTHTHTKYGSWAEYIKEWDGADDDYNHVYRWDWLIGTGEGWQYAEEEADADKCGDANYRDGILRIFRVVQRKGFLQCQEISVCRNDEPAVREWLVERAKHLQSMWSPLLAVKRRIRISPWRSPHGRELGPVDP